eukprot:CAMPEP_0117543272 /NCGR_PEP_ID=MMETSP0784-20121206/44976_1 /TAXON_ID=39447 /ORGANISM="" /LENGTH=365 /DNA_ID=CAMNT_0005340047 /DNA_START=1 /DNA_END=1095 /DNA_ORIENTATION=+
MWLPMVGVVVAPLFVSALRPEPPRAAVCLSGDVRGGVEVLENIADRVLRPLAADVFVYMPLKRLLSSDGSERLSPSAELLARLYALPGLMALHIEVENATALLAVEMRRRQHSETAAEHFYELTRAVGGNWLGGIEEVDPAGDGERKRRRHGSGLFQQLSWRRCLEMVEKAELAAGGRQYDWIIPSRMSMFWEYAHIPLELLSPDAVWVPEGMDWGGLNDRHAVIPRRAKIEEGSLTFSEMYLDSWRFIGEGKAAMVLHMALRGDEQPSLSQSGCDPKVDGLVQQPCLNMENWLAIRLRSTGVKVKRLPQFGWLVCEPAPTQAPGPTGTVFRQLVRECEEMGTPYRYAREYGDAREMADCFRDRL